MVEAHKELMTLALEPAEIANRITRCHFALDFRQRLVARIGVRRHAATVAAAKRSTLAERPAP